jgi:hypothetical protein
MLHDDKIAAAEVRKLATERSLEVRARTRFAD